MASGPFSLPSALDILKLPAASYGRTVDSTVGILGTSWSSASEGEVGAPFVMDGMCGSIYMHVQTYIYVYVCKENEYFNPKIHAYIYVYKHTHVNVTISCTESWIAPNASPLTCERKRERFGTAARWVASELECLPSVSGPGLAVIYDMI